MLRLIAASRPERRVAHDEVEDIDGRSGRRGRRFGAAPCRAARTQRAHQGEQYPPHLLYCTCPASAPRLLEWWSLSTTGRLPPKRAARPAATPCNTDQSCWDI